MNDSFFVRSRESMGDLRAVVDCFANRQQPARQQLAERAAVQ